MLKFIIPAAILFLIVLFWEKINDKIYEKFEIKRKLIMAKREVKNFTRFRYYLDLKKLLNG